MTFKLEHHNKIVTVLECLDSDIVTKGSAYFGDGTLLTLDFEEYRRSKDVDFIASVNTEGYKYLRTMIFEGGYKKKNEKIFKLTSSASYLS